MENLPHGCPPDDAYEPEGMIVYRMIDGNTAQKSDFYSHRKLFPERLFNTSVCQACSLSVFSEYQDCCKILRLPAHREKKKSIVKIALYNSSGRIKKTGHKNHYSWWLYAEYLPHLKCEVAYE